MENKCEQNIENINNITYNIDNATNLTEEEAINNCVKKYKVDYDCSKLFSENKEFFLKLKQNSLNEYDIDFLIKLYFLSNKVFQNVMETIENIKHSQYDIVKYNYTQNKEIDTIEMYNKTNDIILSRQDIENIKIELYGSLDNISSSDSTISKTNIESIVEKLYEIQSEYNIDYSSEIKDLEKEDLKLEKLEKIYESIINKIDNKLKIIDEDIKNNSKELWKYDLNNIVFYFDKDYNKIVPTIESLSFLLSKLNYFLNGLNMYFTSPIQNKTVKEQIKDNKYIFKNIINILGKIKTVFESDMLFNNEYNYNDSFDMMLIKNIKNEIKPCGINHSCIYYIKEIEKTFDNYFNY